jgi:hypothetical protein
VKRKEISRMTREKVVSLIAVLAMLFVIAAPAAAAEKTFEVRIPGCAS